MKYAVTAAGVTRGRKIVSLKENDAFTRFRSSWGRYVVVYWAAPYVTCSRSALGLIYLLHGTHSPSRITNEQSEYIKVQKRPIVTRKIINKNKISSERKMEMQENKMTNAGMINNPSQL